MLLSECCRGPIAFSLQLGMNQFGWRLLSVMLDIWRRPRWSSRHLWLKILANTSTFPFCTDVKIIVNSVHRYWSADLPVLNAGCFEYRWMYAHDLRCFIALMTLWIERHEVEGNCLLVSTKWLALLNVLLIWVVAKIPVKDYCNVCYGEGCICLKLWTFKTWTV